MKKSIFTLLTLIQIFISCQKREWTNPFDSACPKEIWTPIDFKAIVEGTTVKLTWSQPINNISGFKLTKKVDIGTAANLQNQTKEANQYVDAILTGGKVHTYTIAANAGNNLSNVVTVQITPFLTPGITTNAVSSVTSNFLISGGVINTDGGASITARGVCWSKNPNPTIADSKTTDGTGTGSFTSSITGLTPGAIYYIRAYATNSVGTAYGSDVTFTTTSSSGGAVIDVDGNVYSTVTIGTQVWMASNLKTTKFNNGTAIPLVTDNTAWTNLPTPGYCWYNNAVANKDTYGALYNWYTVNTGKLCPSGWHVPTDSEWITLTTYLGGESVAGGKLKETGTSRWQSPNSGATNADGFTALPGGVRGSGGTFVGLGGSGYWWSSTVSSSTYAWSRNLNSDRSNIIKIDYPNKYGFTVRCLLDELTLTTIPTNGLVAYYPFNGNANDESGNGNNGTIYSATLSKDRFNVDNRAYKINGSGSKIVIADKPIFNSSNQITFSTWANPTSTWNYEAQHIISKEVAGGYGFSLGFDQNSSVYGEGNYSIFLQIVKPSGYDYIYKVISPSELAGWKHIVGVIDGNTFKIFLNGLEVASKTVTGLQFINSGPINIGARDLRNDQPYFGFVDDVRIYNRALSGQEVQSLYNE